MKITFEGDTIQKILIEMEDMLATIPSINTLAENPYPRENPPSVVPEAIVPEAIAPVDKPVEKPKRERTAKQLENDERLREAAKAKLAAKKIVKADMGAGIVQPVRPTPPPPASAESLGLAPDEIVRVRQKTIEDLQTAYANGHQDEVFELLSRFGNGAKSFRELPPEAFVPIREAIDLGALEGEAPK